MYITTEKLSLSTRVVFYDTNVLNFQLRSDKTPTLERLTSNLEKIKTHGKSTKIKPFPLSSFVDGDLKNHLVYWSTKGNDDTKLITWIISSKPVFISNVVVRKNND